MGNHLRATTLTTVVAVAMALAACDTTPRGGPRDAGDPADPAAPVEAITVTETVTVEPDGGLADPCSARLEDDAFIFVTRPTSGRAVISPLRVDGCANTFEAQVQWRLLGRGDQEELAAGNTSATCGSGCVGTFSFEVEFTVDEEQVGTLEVYETSPEDGAVQLLSRTPVLLRP